MYCPRCGNQPLSDRARFCPNCGLRLDGVAELLARDGAPVNVPPAGPSPRKRGVQRGAQIFFTGVVMFLPIGGFAEAVNEEAFLFLPATVTMAGFFWIIYYWLFGDREASAVQAIQPTSPPAAARAYLSPQSTPVYQPPAEPPRQQSVIEHTTRSLEQQ